VIMENMRDRIARGDIKRERAEAIKVRLPKAVMYTLVHMTKRQCVTSRPLGQLNYNNAKCNHTPNLTSLLML